MQYQVMLKCGYCRKRLASNHDTADPPEDFMRHIYRALDGHRVYECPYYAHEYRGLRPPIGPLTSIRWWIGGKR